MAENVITIGGPIGAGKSTLIRQENNGLK